MGEFIGLTAVVLIFGSVPAIIIFIIAKRHKEKMELINRGTTMPIQTQSAQINSGSAPLLWGLIAFSLGLALIFGGYVIQHNVDRDMVTMGMFFFFGGGAILIYWKLTKNERDTARTLNEEYMKTMIENLKKTNEDVK